jgi:hypothetical protein
MIRRYESEGTADAALKGELVRWMKSIESSTLRIIEEANNAIAGLPRTPKEFIESIAAPALKSCGALIVSSGVGHVELDAFRTVKVYQGNQVSLYQKK